MNSEFTSISIDEDLQETNESPPPRFADIVLQVQNQLDREPSNKVKKLKRKNHRRAQTSPSSFDSSSGSVRDMDRGQKLDRRRSTIHKIRNLQENFKHVHLKEFTHEMILNLRPTKIPFVKRFIKWGKQKFPGHPKLKFILHHPYFFLYIISMALVQALLSGISSADIMLSPNWSLSEVVSLVFFILYIMEILMRIYIKGFEFFLSFYNAAEVSLTLSAFILDFQLEGTSFVANVLSLRIIWCIHKVPGMRFVVEGIKKAAPRISIIIFPLLILIYVFAVVATSTLGPHSYDYYSADYWQDQYQYTFPNGTTITVPGAGLNWDYYGNIAKSMFTLFQVMTGDAWADNIARPTMKARPWSFVLFISFYSLFSFVLLNIFTGIMVDAIQSYEKEKNDSLLLKKEELKQKQLAEKRPVSMSQDSVASQSSTVQNSLESLNANNLILKELQNLREEMNIFQSKMQGRLAILEPNHKKTID